MSPSITDELPENLKANAEAVFSLAPLYCRPEHRCLEYHRFWPLARIARGAPFQLAGTAFFLSNLRRGLQADREREETRILIAGAADTAMLDLVYAGIDGASATVVLADRCETVIRQNQQFAGQLGIDLECHQTDFLQLDCRPVDIIVAHSLMAFIAPEARPRLFAKWHALLSPQGEVYLSNLMHPVMPTQALVPSSPLTAEKFLAAAKLIGLSADQLEELSTALADGWNIKPLLHRAPVLDDFLELCSGSGFKLLKLEAVPFLEKERGPVVSGTYAESQRVEVCLCKQ